MVNGDEMNLLQEANMNVKVAAQKSLNNKR